jgi:soluble lytic murein transglycosylase
VRRALYLLLALVAVGGLVGAYALEAEPDWYVRVRYPLHYETIVRAHADNYDLDPALVAAVIYTESRFDPAARSSAGAIGLMQLLPSTAQGIADRTGGGSFVPDDLFEPEINIRYGCWYLRHLIERFDGHPNAVDLALAAYNAGQGTVDGWIAGTAPGAAVAIPFPETRAYLGRIRHLRALYARAYDLSPTAVRDP